VSGGVAGVVASLVRPGEVFRAAVEDEIWLRAAGRGDTLVPATTVVVEFPEGEPDPGLLAASLAHVVASRDVLACGFEAGGGEVLCRPGAFGVGLAVAEPAVAWTVTRPLEDSIDPFGGPLVRSLWQRRGAGSVWLLQMSHAVVDGMSWRLVLRDIASAYAVLAGGGELAVTPWPQMRDWARLQRAEYDGQRVACLERWRELFDVHGLSAPGPVAGPLVSGSLAWEGPAGLWDRVCERAAGLGSSPSLYLLAMFAQSWRRNAGGRPVAVRVPYLNRDLPGAEEVVGNLATQLLIPFGADLNDDTDDLARSARRGLAGAIGCLPLSLEEAAQQLWDCPIEDLNRQSPLFSVNLQKMVGSQPMIAGGLVTLLPAQFEERPGVNVEVNMTGTAVKVQTSWFGQDSEQMGGLLAAADGFVGAIAGS
jgi:condensation domain-containing protein